jgi:hypothetical protein
MCQFAFFLINIARFGVREFLVRFEHLLDGLVVGIQKRAGVSVGA